MSLSFDNHRLKRSASEPAKPRSLERLVGCRSSEDWNDLADLYECAADLVRGMHEQHTKESCAHAEKHLRKLAMRATAKASNTRLGHTEK